MDKRDNYFETRIRAARAQINQCRGSFSLPQDLVFRAGARLLVGCAGGWALVPDTKTCWGKMLNPEPQPGWWCEPPRLSRLSPGSHP